MQGLTDKSISAFKKAVKLAPGNAGFRNDLGNSLLDDGRFDEAEQSYRQALKRNPLLIDALCNLANLLATLKKEDEAELYYRRAFSLLKSSVPAEIGGHQ